MKTLIIAGLPSETVRYDGPFLGTQVLPTQGPTPGRQRARSAAAASMTGDQPPRVGRRKMRSEEYQGESGRSRNQYQNRPRPCDTRSQVGTPSAPAVCTV